MSNAEMKVTPERALALTNQIRGVTERIQLAAKGRPVRLVAVSKLKPANDILCLHTGAAQQEDFGENYAQELVQKAALLPRSIRWHFIGGLQSTHCKTIAKVPNLWCVSSVDSLKKAQLLDRARGELIAAAAAAASSSEQHEAAPQPLNVHVQVNTSGEASKSGCAPGPDTAALCGAVARDCGNLRLLGLMTIGAIARSRATTPETENQDFAALVEQRALVAAELGLASEEDLELSMGMSDDLDGAIAMGSGEVRVGSTIFGDRPAKADAEILV
ncbi:hypothetical protein RB595_005086 [Gaeumannomyces hyphopodioides]